MKNKPNLLHKIIFTIIIIPTLLLSLLLILNVSFALIYRKQISEGIAKTVADNFFKPIIFPIILLTEITINNDQNRLKTSEKQNNNIKNEP